MADEVEDLYEDVWGEPAPESNGSALPGGIDRAPLISTPAGRARSPVVVNATETAILRRVEQLEARVFEIQQSLIDDRKLLEMGLTELTEAFYRLHDAVAPGEAGTIHEQTIMRAVHALEVQMVRMERGMVRSLEYLESKIKEIGR